MPAARRRWRPRAWARARCCSPRTSRRWAQMSCNPAIGGIGKGHLVREIDALGGAMARATDLAGIQFRTLNASKGPAVRATRAQADRQLYRQAIRARLENQPHLVLFQQEVADLIVEGGAGAGRRHASAASRFEAARGGAHGRHVPRRPHPRRPRAPCPAAAPAMRPRTAWPPACGSCRCRSARLKTGTPPRIDGRTLDWSAMTPPARRRPAPVFSYLGRANEHPSRLIATSHRPMSGPTTSSARPATARRCSPAASRAWGRATARPSRTRSCALPTRPRTRSSSSPRG